MTQSSRIGINAGVQLSLIHIYYAASDINYKDALKNYVYMRDKLLLIANEKVIIKLLEFEDKGVGKTTDLHNKYLTELLKAIRKDLKLGYKSLPIL